QAEIDDVIKNTKLSQFIKESEKGINTIIYPEAKQTSYTVAKKIILARAIVKKPKLLILEDPLEHFEKDEALELIKFLTDASHPWTLIVVSFNKDWASNCTESITLKKGQII
ncbi:MAG: ABC transporter ATP-binding protein, partial [Winogradskyella sp.]